MDREELFTELNKILTLEHGHLGMYENYITYKDKEIRQTMRRFMELEMIHINKIQNIIRNLGKKPSLLVEGGDIIGKMFGITVNFGDLQQAFKSFNYIEELSHKGYGKFITKLELQDKEIYSYIAQIVFTNQLEARFQHLWLKDKLSQYNH